MLSLVANHPLDLETLGRLLSDRDELFLVWPDARFPFDPEQWRERLNSQPGNRSYFVVHAGEIIGHAALLETDEPHVLAMSYLFIRPDRRGRGLGRELIRLLEDEAREDSRRAGAEAQGANLQSARHPPVRGGRLRQGRAGRHARHHAQIPGAVSQRPRPHGAEKSALAAPRCGRTSLWL